MPGCVERSLAATASTTSCVLPEGSLVIIESTCPVGTTEQVRDALRAAGAPDRIHLAYCPERVLPGRILHELAANDRIIGGIDAVSADAASAFYRGFVTGSLFLTSSRTAVIFPAPAARGFPD